MAVAIFGLVTSLAIHITAYLRFIDMDFFLLYCRAEWMGVGLVALMLGWFMPSSTPRKQLLMLVKWLSLACIILSLYLGFGVFFYLKVPHPKKLDNGYAMMQGSERKRWISHETYQRLSSEEHRVYVMYINRAFSLMWVTLYFGISLNGLLYLRQLKQCGDAELSTEIFVPWWYGGA